MTQYPEHERVRAIQAESQAIGSFIEWLREETEMEICEPVGRGYEWFPNGTQTQEILAKYFEIDLAKLEAEKQAMLDAFRAETTP